MKTIITSIVLCLLSFPLLFAQNNVEFSAGYTWIGYMNVTDLPADGGGFQFGSAWAVGDLKSTLSTASNTLTLQPNFNTYNASDPFWTNPNTGAGNKNMEALTFVEPGASFNGVDLTFFGTVQAYTLDVAYTVKFFIKALDPANDYADVLGGAKVMDLPASGAFSVSATAAELPAGLVIQYGFSVTGVNANPADEAALGSVTIGASPVAVNELNELPGKISIYPNPTANNRLSIRSESPVQSYQVSTLLGQSVLRGKATNEIDLSSLAAGTYLITVQLKEGEKMMKFIKH